MNTLVSDMTASAVVDAYRFLYGVEPSEAPKSSSLFMYCQPYLVRSQSPVDDGRRVRGAAAHTAVRNMVQQRAVERAEADSSPLEPIFEKQESIQPWVASTERFAEQVQLRFQQSARDDVVDDEAETEPAQSMRQEVAFETVDKLRAAVARMAASDTGGLAGGGAA
jgi:hypothetical protein